MATIQQMVEFERIDATRNMHRFYSIEVLRDLFGTVIARRSWGRIGTLGRAQDHAFATEQDAVEAAAQLETAKRRRGYVDRHPAPRKCSPG